MREFWRRTYTLPRMALACAGLAAGLNVGSYVGLTIDSAGGSLTFVHALVLILGVTLFVRAGYERMLTVWRRAREVHGDPIPRSLVWATVAAALYMVALIAVVAVIHGEGHAELRDGREVWVVGNSVVRILPPGSVEAFAASSLRVFSASWLFFALLIALLGHPIEQRIRAARLSSRQAV